MRHSRFFLALSLLAAPVLLVSAAHASIYGVVHGAVREHIARTPGADRTNSMAMITDFVPGTHMTHGMLHVRDGHQLDWKIDGVAIVNTNIAGNRARWTRQGATAVATADPSLRSG